MSDILKFISLLATIFIFFVMVSWIITQSLLTLVILCVVGVVIWVANGLLDKIVDREE